MNEQASTYKKKVLFFWNSPGGLESCMERIVVFEDGTLELSANGKGMGISIAAVVESLWMNRAPSHGAGVERLIKAANNLLLIPGVGGSWWDELREALAALSNDKGKKL